MAIFQRAISHISPSTHSENISILLAQILCAVSGKIILLCSWQYAYLRVAIAYATALDKTRATASRPYCHPELVEGSRGNETTLYARHYTSFRYREIATLALAMTAGGFCDKQLAERATKQIIWRNCGRSFCPCLNRRKFSARLAAK